MPVFTAWWMGSPIWIATITLKTSNRPSRSIMSCFEPYFLGTYIIHISQCSFAAIHISAGDFFPWETMVDTIFIHFPMAESTFSHGLPWRPGHSSSRKGPVHSKSQVAGAAPARPRSVAKLTWGISATIQ